MTGLLPGLDDVEQLPPDESLTTKEGWRRFVAHQPTPPVFPDSAELAALSSRARATLVQPVVYVTVPTDATPKMLAVEFARFYGVEFSARATMPDIVNTVCAVAARTHLELVLIDEIHNILGTRARAEVSDQLKYFAERLPATFAYAGIEVEERGMFAGPRGRQIAGRFTLIDSTPFDYGTAEQKAAWRSLIATLEQSLRLLEHQPGALVELADYLYERTGGAIGSLSMLIRGAAVLAIDDETEQITTELLDLVPLDRAATSTTPARRRRAGSAGKR